MTFSFHHTKSFTIKLLRLLHCKLLRKEFLLQGILIFIVLMEVGNIGGHGFWDKGGVYTLGVSEKNFAAASGGRNTWV